MTTGQLPATESETSTLESSPPQKQAPEQELLGAAAPGPEVQSATPSKFLRLCAALLILLVIIGAVIGVVVLASVGKKEGPKLTHTISRDNLTISITERGTLESADNTEIKCKVRGYSTVTWVIEGGSIVEPGDELVRLDTKRIEDAIRLHTTDSYTAQATLERSKANVAQAEIAEQAYLEGRFKTQKQSLDRELKIAERNLEIAEKMLANSKSMFNRGYVSELEVEGNQFTVTQAKLELEVKQTQLSVLEKYTKQMELETIRGNLKASKSKLAADKSGLAMDEGRRDKAIRELEDCVIKADRKGMVIYPSAAAWKDTPDVTEGASVRKDQVLLLMPDLDKMQVKIGIHESMIDRVRPGLPAKIKMAEMTLDGKVGQVAAVAQPAGWWTGNVVKYDTIIEIPSTTGLKPGMSAEVEVVLEEHEDVLTIPVAAVVETEAETLCWVTTPDGLQRRPVQLGDGNDVFVLIESGLEEGEVVVLNPRAHVKEAKDEVMNTLEGSDDQFKSQESLASDSESSDEADSEEGGSQDAD